MKKIGVGKNEKEVRKTDLMQSWNWLDKNLSGLLTFFWLKNKMIWDNFAETTICQIRRFGSGRSIAVEHTTSYAEDFLLFTSFQVPQHYWFY